MINRHSLSFRIITRVLLITVSLFIITLWVTYFYARKSIRESTRSYAIELAGNISGRIEKELRPMEKLPQVVSNSVEAGILHSDDIMPFLATIVKQNKNVFGASVAFEPEYTGRGVRYFMPYVCRNGDSLSSSMLGGSGYEYFLMDWYQIPKMMGKPYWSEPYYDEGGGKILMSTYSVPIYINSGGKREFIGVATVDISIDRLTEFASQVKVLKTGYALLLSQNGILLTYPDRKKIMNSSIFSDAEEMNVPMLRQIGRELRAGNSGFTEIKIPGKEKEWIYYTNLSSNRWSLGVVYPESEMFASLTTMNILLAVLISAGLFLLLILTTGIVKRLTSPLAHFSESAGLIAGGNFDVKLPEVHTRDEMMRLRDAFSNMQKQLAVYIEDLRKTTTDKEKIESELRIARDIQMSMIPHTFPPFPNLPQIDLFALLKSAKEVGGDLYDFFLIDKEKFCFAIGDVSGKGVPASLIVAVTRTLLRSISDLHKTPSAIVRSLNKSLSADNDSCMFVTFFLGILDLNNGTLSYANAGHNPPVLLKQGGGMIMLGSGKSIPLGLNEDFDFSEERIILDKGDKIFAYTDGVTEAENSQSILFGDERLLNMIRESCNCNPRQLIRKIEEQIDGHVNGFSQSDDITMMTIEYRETTI